MLTIADSSLSSLIEREALFERYIRYLDVSEGSAKTYMRALRRLSVWLEENEISCPTREHLIEYKKHLTQTLRPTTVQTYISVVRLFFAFLSDEGIYPNIAERLKGARIDPAFRKDSLTSAQVRCILDNISGDDPAALRDRAMLLLMVTAGLRCIEIARADVNDLRTAGGRSVLYIHGKGRSEKTEFVVIEPHTETLIRQYLAARKPGSPALFASTSNNSRDHMTSRAVSGIIKQRLVSAGFDSERLTAHSLRHTCVTLSLQAGIPLEEVRQHARHRSLQTTLTYSHALSAQNNRSSAAVADSLF